jgi:lipopolysaccharide biosynthesis glycosyltransferase
MENKQTAVEWLISQQKHNQFFDIETIEQAKEMEKEQIIEGYGHGHNDGCRYMNNEKQEFKESEQYYIETYGGNK